MLALCACFCMVMLDSTIVTVAIPTMLDRLDANLNQVVWVNSVYLLANTVPLLLTGRLGDRYGPKRLLVVGLMLFTAASLWAGLSNSAGMLITARAVQGLGAAAMTPQTLSFISRLFPAAKRGVPIAVWGAVSGVATISGPVLGGLLTEHAGWQWIFLINVPIGLVSLAIALLALPNWQPGRRLRFDVVGALLCSTGLALIVFAVQNGQHYHWGTVLGPLSVPLVAAIGVALLGVFGWRHLRGRFGGRDPLLPPALFRSTTFTCANLTHAAMGFAMTGMFLPLVLYLQTVLGLSPLRSATVAIPMAVLAAVSATIAGAVWPRVGARNLIMAGLAMLAAGVAFVAVQAGPDADPAVLMPGLAVAGLGIGLVFSPLTSAATALLTPAEIGAASGVFNTSRQVGGVLGSAATGVLLQLGVAIAVPAAARQYAERLPYRMRGEFIGRVTEAANTASQFSSTDPPLPPDLPKGSAELVARIVGDVFHIGLTNAAKASLVLPIIVLLLGIVSAAGIRVSRRDLVDKDVNMDVNRAVNSEGVAP